MIKMLALAAAAAFAVGAAAPALAAPQGKPTRQTVAAPAPDSAAARAARVDRMFRVADRNKDGALSRSEYSRWYKVAARRRGPLTWRKHASQLFKQLDVGQKGRLTKADFASDPAFRRTRPGWTRSVITALSDGDQSIGLVPDAPASGPAAQ